MISDQDNTVDAVHVRLASTPEEVAEAQRLRYTVFYEEYNAVADEQTARTRMDVDEFDAVADHLIVVDETLPEGQRIVGTYRLLRRDVAEKFGKFYSSNEFDITPLMDSIGRLLELGRSCVREEYRTRAVLQKLWQGIAHYVDDHKIELLFGCGSLYGTDIDALAPQLSYLYHYHLASPELCPRARDGRFIKMDLIPKDQLDAKAVFMTLPPLIKGYIRVGAFIGNGAVIDSQWNSTDVCIVMPTHLITEKYMKHYKRENTNAVRVERDLAERIAALDKEFRGLMRTIIAAIKITAYLALTFACIPVQMALLRLFPAANPYVFPKWYHRQCCRIFRMKVIVEGEIERSGHVVFISNHISYLDIPVIASVIPTAFVAKKDVAAWPLFGTLARLQRTHLISRSPADADKEKNAFVQRLEEPLPLVLFAEGTNSVGSSILPFKSSMFEVFLNKKIKLQPLTISLLQLDEENVVTDSQREIFAWGDIEIPEHLWRFSKGKGCVVKLIFHKPLSADCYNDRKQLSNDCYKSVAEGLDLSHQASYGLVQNSR